MLVLRWSVGKDVLDFVAGQVEALIGYADAGIEFLFGPLIADKEETIFALQVLPVIIFIGALVGLLFYLRVIQWVVEIVGGAIAWALHTTKVESLYAATVIFLGQSEAPLMIQSYLSRLTRSELFVGDDGRLRLGRRARRWSATRCSARRCRTCSPPR